ncbi:MAG: hypothetical protein HY925_05645 [Elusimicrobia bacterium]|nr:hypothetical protein [Elusimicrobiota bacterium]
MDAWLRLREAREGAGLILSLVLLALPAFAQMHSCAGDEKTHYGYTASKDSCRGEAEHVCNCRKQLHKNNQAYYDSSRDLCLDEWVQFQCLEKGGDWMCREPGKCLCDAKPPRCKEAELGAWTDKGCGMGDCEDTRLLQGREPKAKAVCKGGGRWRCVASPKCPSTGKKTCSEADFGPWRETGCAMGGCPKGTMRLQRDKKTHLLCDEGLYKKCLMSPACAK